MIRFGAGLAAAAIAAAESATTTGGRHRKLGERNKSGDDSAQEIVCLALLFDECYEAANG